MVIARLVLELFDRFHIVFAIIPLWSKWYLPIHVYYTQYVITAEFTVSLFWVIHFSVRFPTVIRKSNMTKFLPRRARSRRAQ